MVRIVARLRRGCIATLAQQDRSRREVSTPCNIPCRVGEKFSCTSHPRRSAEAMISSRRQDGWNVVKVFFLLF